MAAAAKSLPDAPTLAAKLLKTEHDLAECIDEIVYAENAQAVAEQRLRVTEECLQDALGYISTVESQILVPAFGGLVSALTESSRKKRQGMMRSADGIGEVSDRTKRLLQRIREPSEQIVKHYANERDAILNQQTGYPVDIQAAFVALELFLQSKEELRALLEDARHRITTQLLSPPVSSASGVRMNGSHMESAVVSRSGSRAPDAVDEDTARLRQQLERVTYERDQLIIKASEEPKPFAELQVQYHAEKDQLQRQITQLKSQLQSHADERFALRERFETLQRALDQAYQEKALIAEEHSKCSSGNTQAAKQHAAAHEEMHQLRLQMDAMTREHSATVTSLEGQLAQLRMDAAHAHSNGAAHDRETVAQLQRTNQALRNDLAVLQQRLLSSSPSTEGALETKIQAFEMTISALNSELALVEGKIASVERHYTEERARIVRNFDDERRRFQMEREECDALVLKMTNELECLVRENAALKARTPKLGVN